MRQGDAQPRENLGPWHSISVEEYDTHTWLSDTGSWVFYGNCASLHQVCDDDCVEDVKLTSHTLARSAPLLESRVVHEGRHVYWDISWCWKIAGAIRIQRSDNNHLWTSCLGMLCASDDGG